MYFAEPEKFCVWHEKDVACDLCGQIKRCFNADTFIGEETISAICPACLAAGKLAEKNITTCSGDSISLIAQLKSLHQNLTEDEINAVALELTDQLETATPHLVTWQDWDWPAADGDYCRFLGYGSKALYKELAQGEDAHQYFTDSLAEFLTEDSDETYLWEEMPEKAIKNYADSTEHSLLFYIFKSLHSDKIITVWDEE